jgi:hypothetical protein
MSLSKTWKNLKTDAKIIGVQGLNNILVLSTQYKDAEFPFWNGVHGTFGAIVYSAIVEQGIDPKSVYIDGKTRKVTYKGRTRRIAGSFNCNNIMKFIMEVETKTKKK